VLDVRASEINDEMKVAAAVAIAGVIPDSHISEDFIIPSVFDQNVSKRVARGVSQVAQETGVARRRQRRGDEVYAAFRS
jgi:malate dehydrogenase (oxaloacetate-decarboxylating)